MCEGKGRGQEGGWKKESKGESTVRVGSEGEGGPSLRTRSSSKSSLFKKFASTAHRAKQWRAREKEAGRRVYVLNPFPIRASKFSVPESGNLHRRAKEEERAELDFIHRFEVSASCKILLEAYSFCRVGNILCPKCLQLSHCRNSALNIQES